jgi:hypothetical protein
MEAYKVVCITLLASLQFVFTTSFAAAAQNESLSPALPFQNVVSDAADIQKSIDSLPVAGGTIFIKAGIYSLTKGLHIKRSNVTLTGERGTVLKLADQVRQPVILIGTDREYPENDAAIGNIRISDLEIDGNKDKQEGDLAEFDPSRCADPENPTHKTCWVRNNGIDVRMVSDLWIENIEIHNARSGGLVVSWKSKRIFVSRSSFHDNFFDGIALYDSEDIHVSDFFCFSNGNAGLSLDNRLSHTTFSNGTIRNNKDVGFFVRDARDLAFSNLMVHGNQSHGCFLSHREKEEQPGVIEKNTGVKRLFFSSSSFVGNSGYGLQLASTDDESFDNAIIGCFFSNNKKECIYRTGGQIREAANICQSE